MIKSKQKRTNQKKFPGNFLKNFEYYFMYEITKYTNDKAKKLGVQVYPSDNPKYKIEIYKNGVFIGYVGDSEYSDYPHYLKTHGKPYADQRRRLYKMRHERYRHDVGSRSWYADQLLW